MVYILQQLIFKILIENPYTTFRYPSSKGALIKVTPSGLFALRLNKFKLHRDSIVGRSPHSRDYDYLVVSATKDSFSLYDEFTNELIFQIHYQQLTGKLETSLILKLGLQYTQFTTFATNIDKNYFPGKRGAASGYLEQFSSFTFGIVF